MISCQTGEKTENVKEDTKETEPSATESNDDNEKKNKDKPKNKVDEINTDDGMEDDVVDEMDLTIPKLDIGSQFGEDNNMEYEHTEREIVEEYMDEAGRIYFAMDDYPVRSIINEEGTISNMTNYGDAYINMLEGLAYAMPESSIPMAYDFFIANPPEDLRDKKKEDYRSWEEATNLERGIMQVVLLSSQPLNAIGIMMENDIYQGEQFETAQKEFFDLGNPTVLIPAPQSVMDMTLFENMQMVQSLWEELGKFENPEQHKEEFEELYHEVRQEMNNVVVRVNYTLSEELHGD